MATPLKELFSPEFVRSVSLYLKPVLPGFSATRFSRKIFSDNWEQLELKQRMRRITTVFHEFMPAHFPDAAQKMLELLQYMQEQGVRENSLEYMFLPDYIEVYGLNHFEPSVQALEQVTCFASAEFAVRPFIHLYQTPMLNCMLEWTAHPNEKVRRLASEGSRPRLPWAMVLPALVKDPTPALPILENLKQDVSEYVRRSVANHLNDISKDHPNITLQLLEQWQGLGPDTDRLRKHGARTLLKKGHPKALRYFGITASPKITMKELVVETPKVKMGGSVCFSFELALLSNKPRLIRLEYAVWFQKANGSLGKKVFKISEKEYPGGTTVKITRNHSFRPITTRVYYKGLHELTVIVNGEEKGRASFRLY